MKPLSDNQQDHLKAAVLERFLMENRAFHDFRNAMRNLEPERFDKHFLVQDEQIFLNTFICINLAFDWVDAQENGWGEIDKWVRLDFEFDSFYDVEYRHIESFIYETILGYDLQRFFEEQSIGIDLFIAEVVRQKSIEDFELYVNQEHETKNPIMNGFTWSSAIDLGTTWSELHRRFESFRESKSEVAAL
jgi:hypothetical protein